MQQEPTAEAAAQETTPQIERQAAANTPLDRIGQPHDVADIVVSLVSGQARSLTGQLIHVSGHHRNVEPLDSGKR